MRLYGCECVRPDDLLKKLRTVYRETFKKFFTIYLKVEIEFHKKSSPFIGYGQGYKVLPLFHVKWAKYFCLP